VKTYKVQVTETLQRIVEVEATDEDAAVDAVNNQYRDEEIILDSDDANDVEIEVVERNN